MFSEINLEASLSSPRKTSQNFFSALCVFLCLFFFWELSCQAFDEVLFILPKPSQVFLRIFHFPKLFLFHSFVTLKEMVGGILFAFSAAFPLAWCMERYKFTRSILQPLFILIQCMPMFTLAPIMVLFFGWSFTAIIIPTTLMIVFPLTLNIYQGLRSTPCELLDLFLSNQSTEWQTFSKLRLPWALPHIFSGLRISSAIAGVGAIAGEWAGAQEGLGMLMQESRRNMDLDSTFAGFFCLTSMSFLFYSSITFLEKKCLHMKTSRPSRKLCVTSLLLLISCFLPSCSSQDLDPQQTRLLLDWLPNPNHVPLYAGIQEGIFKKYDIDLSIQKIHDPSDSIPYLTSSQTDLSVYYMPHTIQAKSLGARIKVIGILFDHPLDALLFRKDSNIQSLEDLEGLSMAYSLGGINSAFVRSSLNEQGIYPQHAKKVNFDIVSSLASKQIDASFGVCWNIESEHLKSFGIETRWFTLTELNIPNYYELIVLGHEDYLQKNPSFAKKFQQALAESIHFSIQFPNQAFEHYALANPDKSPKTLSWEKNAWNITFPLLAKNQEIEIDCWQTFIKWMLKENLIEHAIDPTSFVCP